MTLTHAQKIDEFNDCTCYSSLQQKIKQNATKHSEESNNKANIFPLDFHCQHVLDVLALENSFGNALCSIEIKQKKNKFDARIT